MTKHLKADSLLQVLEDSLKSDARMTGLPTADVITLKFQSKPKLRLEDSTGRLFELDELELRQFLGTVPAVNSIKWIKIKNFEFETKFDFKNGQTKCVEIVLISTDFDLIGESQTFAGRGPLLKTILLPNIIQLSDLSPQVNRYLTRIGKRKFVSQADMPIYEIPSLVSFIPKISNPLAQLTEISRKKAEDVDSIRKANKINYLSQLNPQGHKQLKKLLKHLKRKDTFQHCIRVDFRDPIHLHQIGAVLIKPQYLKDEDASQNKSDL